MWEKDHNEEIGVPYDSQLSELGGSGDGNSISQNRKCSLKVFFVFFFLMVYIFIYFQFLAVLGLCCCTWAFSSCDEQGLLFVAVHDLLMRFEGFSVISKGEVLHEGETTKRNECHQPEKELLPLLDFNNRRERGELPDFEAHSRPGSDKVTT